MFKKNKTKKINKAKKNNTNNIGTYRETEEGGGEKPIQNIGDISLEEGSRSKRMSDISIRIETLDLLI